jgi:hypothetical protein
MMVSVQIINVVPSIVIVAPLMNIVQFPLVAKVNLANVIQMEQQVLVQQ